MYPHIALHRSVPAYFSGIHAAYLLLPGAQELIRGHIPCTFVVAQLRHALILQLSRFGRCGVVGTVVHAVAG